MSLEKKSETKRGGKGREGGGGGLAWNGGATRGAEEGYVDVPVLPRLVEECSCTQRPKPTRELLDVFVSLLWVWYKFAILVTFYLYHERFCQTSHTMSAT